MYAAVRHFDAFRVDHLPGDDLLGHIRRDDLLRIHCRSTRHFRHDRPGLPAGGDVLQRRRTLRGGVFARLLRGGLLLVNRPIGVFKLDVLKSAPCRAAIAPGHCGAPHAECGQYRHRAERLRELVDSVRSHAGGVRHRPDFRVLAEPESDIAGSSGDSLLQSLLIGFTDSAPGPLRQVERNAVSTFSGLIGFFRRPLETALNCISGRIFRQSAELRQRAGLRHFLYDRLKHPPLEQLLDTGDLADLYLLDGAVKRSAAECVQVSLLRIIPGILQFSVNLLISFSGTVQKSASRRQIIHAERRHHARRHIGDGVQCIAEPVVAFDRIDGFAVFDVPPVSAIESVDIHSFDGLSAYALIEAQQRRGHIVPAAPETFRLVPEKSAFLCRRCSKMDGFRSLNLPCDPSVRVERIAHFIFPDPHSIRPGIIAVFIIIRRIMYLSSILAGGKPKLRPLPHS